MAYKALYRTYRPSTFEEVAGQQHIVKTIKNALESDKLAHAYLFAGPRGTGKTTMAKLLAKALNCDEGVGHQCNHCKNCIAINEGTHPDVIEIDAASNNGVDQVRDIVDRVKYGTIMGRKKVFIIDEVHMMSAGAFNALLKTLEEPPEHVIFILATTEPYKVLPTILSRCQRYDFTKVSDNDIKERIKIVLDSENIPQNDKAVDLIISLADGGMRDALSILDQVLAYSGNQLSEKDILDIFSLESTGEKLSLINSIADGDVSDVLNRINNYISKGTDIKRLTNDLLAILKDLLIYLKARNVKFLEQLDKEQVEQLSRKIKAKQATEMIDILMNVTKDYKTVTAINPLFEVTLLKLVTMFTKDDEPVKEENKVVIEPVIEQNDEPVIEPIKPKVEEKKIEQPSLFDLAEKKIEVASDIIVPKGTEGEESFQISDDMMIKIMVTAKKETKNELSKNWDNLKKFIAHPKYGQAASLLADSHLLVASNKIIVIECPLPNMAMKTNSKEMQKDLQSIVNTVFGKQMFVYAVSRSASVDLQNKYTSLYMVGKLPKAKDVVIEFEGE